jgi:hypothetical protein
VTFTVGDAEQSAASLTVKVATSNPAVLPEANILPGGSGSNRWVT